MKEFLHLIDSFLEGTTSYPEFERKVSDFYVKNDKADSLTDEELDFVEQVYDRTTYTSPVEDLPKNDPDRKHGLMDESEFPTWLRELKAKNIHLWG
jgi:hypothetical protein